MAKEPKEEKRDKPPKAAKPDGDKPAKPPKGEKGDGAPKGEKSPKGEKAPKGEKGDKGKKGKAEAEEPAGPAPTPRLFERYHQQVLPTLAEKLSRKNKLSLPRIDKIVVTMGAGAATQE